ncbi:hypothetical protein [Oceanobacillus locisalsi]|uniref:Uncharacterized protein n=1 Tax=Oceanobacillus locisalsi TaxID=546107 RepID=A0ABW3NF90_9BACI
MKQTQLGRSLFAEQMKWAAWFYGIMIILTFAIILANHWGILDNLDVSSTTSNVFLLIIGLLYSYGFLDYYFKLGISRKKFFKASLFASVLLSVILAFAMSLMIGLFETVAPALGFVVPWTDLLISSGVLPFIQSIVDYSISHFFYLLIGWFIGIGFYRFRWKIGLLFILISSPFIGMAEFLQDHIWIESTIIVFYAIFLVMIVILIGFIYHLTKNAPIRL